MSTYQSFSSTNFSSTEVTSITITKPTGLAVGDLMLGFFGKTDTINASSSNITGVTGWTELNRFNNLGDNPDNGEIEFVVYAKVADSSDVAASNFSVTSDQGCFLGGFILRIDGHAGITNILDAGAKSTSAVASYAVSLTPIVEDSLIIAGFMSTVGTGPTTSATYTATPSITFTEIGEINNTSVETDPFMSVAYGAYGSTTEITAFGTTYSSTSDNGGFIICVTPITNATADISHLAITPNVESVTGSNTATATIDHIALEPTLESLTASSTSDETQWTNATKNSTTWTNENKSS